MTPEQMKQIDELIEKAPIASLSLYSRQAIKAIRDENVRLRETLELADAYLSFANMNMKAVEKKVKQALKGEGDENN